MSGARGKLHVRDTFSAVYLSLADGVLSVGDLTGAHSIDAIVERLSPSEQDVLMLMGRLAVVEGITRNEIVAEEREGSPNTVRVHLQSIYSKTDLNRVQLAVLSFYLNKVKA